MALAVFAVLQGMANGIMTIVRGLCVPEMLTRESYGAVNGALALPGTAARALAPVLAAFLWSIGGGSYDLVMVMAFGLTIVALASMLFAAITAPKRAS